MKRLRTIAIWCALIALSALVHHLQRMRGEPEYREGHLQRAEIDAATASVAERRRLNQETYGRFISTTSSSASHHGRTLASLLEQLEREQPAIVAELRPGLSAEEILRLEGQVAPFHLPSSLKALHRWRDGRVETSNRAFPPSAFWLPLAKMIELREQFREHERQNPAWLPVSLADDGTLFTSLVQGPVEYPYIWREPNAMISSRWDGNSHLEHESPAAMIAFVIEAAAISDMGSDYNERMDAAWIRKSPLADTGGFPRGHNDWPRSVGHWTFDWPLEWRAAVGRMPEYYRPKDQVTSIAELSANSKPATVRGQITELSGSRHENAFELSDSSGSIELVCFYEACFDIQIRALVEVDVIKGPRHTSHLAPDASFEATRIVRLDLENVGP